MEPEDGDGSIGLVDRAAGEPAAAGCCAGGAGCGDAGPGDADCAGPALDDGPTATDTPDVADTQPIDVSELLDERRLLLAAQGGDHAAFVALVRTYEPRLRALAYRVLRDPDTVADALQETFLRAYRSLSGFRDEARLGTWLYRVTYNACLDQLAGRRRQLHLVERAADEIERHEPDPAEAVATGDRLSRALDELSPEHRAVVYLCLQKDLDLGTAASVLGIPYGTVGSRLNHARTVLRQALAGEEGR